MERFQKHKYKGTYNVCGEIHVLYGWYDTEAEAIHKLARKLRKKLKRIVYMPGVAKDIIKLSDNKA